MSQMATEALAPRLSAYFDSGALDPSDLQRARNASDAAEHRIDRALVELGILSEDALLRIVETELQVRRYDRTIRPEAVLMEDLLEPAYLYRMQVVPVAASNDTLTLAMVDPLDDFTVKAIGLKVHRAVVRQYLPKIEFDAFFTDIYGEPDRTAQVSGLQGTASESNDVDVLRDAASDAPVIRFVQETIRRAVSMGASDIHLRPSRDGADLQFRIDGTLVPQASPEAGALPSIVSRLKILADLDISERRLPQDGRIRTNVAGRPVDIRLSTMPHLEGEGAVLRILSREVAASSLADLGFSDGIREGLERLFGAPDGLVLVTGPTGSGKSTTLHAALKRLIRPGINIVTIEDPVEYRTEGITQVQVDEKIGLTFPRVLRSLLRQDPDIVLVGEIRDSETAKIAVQAALTGHLVLATLHTNSALAAVPRLIDMGVEPYLLAAAMRGVLAQRLVRKACPHCSAPHTGCGHCSGTRVIGRIAIGELVHLDAELTQKLATNVPTSSEVQTHLERQAYRSLRDDLARRIDEGLIEAAEAFRVVDV